MRSPRPVSLVEWKRLLSNTAVQRRVLGPPEAEERTVRAVQGWRFAMRSPSTAAVFLLRCPENASFEPLCVFQGRNGDLKILEADDLQ